MIFFKVNVTTGTTGIVTVDAIQVCVFHDSIHSSLLAGVHLHFHRLSHCCLCVGVNSSSSHDLREEFFPGHFGKTLIILIPVVAGLEFPRIHIGEGKGN